MAFNPFETFSVRSRTGKTVMAVLGIVVMLTFVLSSGAVGSGMDFFDQISGLFGSGRGKGEVVATAYGDDVRASELDEVRRQRTVAREYLGRAVEESYRKWARELDAEAKAGRLSTDVKDVVGRFAALKLKADTEPQAYRAFVGQFAGQQMGGQMQDLFKFLGAWQATRAKPESDDRKALDAMVAILVHDVGLSPLYLVPIGNEADRDVLDFLVLLKKADKLGVHYSTDGVKELVQADTGRRLTEDDFRKIETALRAGTRSGNVSSEWLAQALANEYRAKVALTAIEGKPVFPEMVKAQRGQVFNFLGRLGVDLGSVRLPGEPATESALAGGLTPYEFFEFYKDRCGEHSFAVLPVNAQDYLDKVTVPSRDDPKYKAELNALFAKHRGELPDPSRERPGFKEPRRVKVEYVALDATAPRVAQAAPKMEAAGAFLQATTGVLTGDPMAALINVARPDAAAESPLAPVEMTARYVARARAEAAQAPYSTLERFEFHPRDTSVYRPQPIVSALGMLAGQPDLATVLGSMAAVHQQVERLDHQARVPFLLQPVLTPFNPTLANALGMPAFALPHAPKAPAEGLYLAEARAAARKDQVRDLFRSDVQQLQEKLRTLVGEEPPSFIPNAPKPDKAKLEKGREEAKAYLATWLKDRGLTPAGNPAPVDQWTVATDPALKPLNDLGKPDPDGSNELSRKLFPDQQNRFGDDVKPFQPFWFPADPVGASADKPAHLVWLTEETEARAIGNNLENADKIAKEKGQPPVSDRVEAAWKLDKARALAEADAKALADKVREIARAANGNRDRIERELRDLAAQRKVQDFSLGRLALLKFEHGTTPAQQGYQTSTIDKSQVLYPTPNFVEKLLELRKEPVGAVTVLPDAPRTHFYVACLVEKYEKTVDQFREVFAKANTTGMDRNLLYAQYALPEERGEAMNDTRLRLQADAGLDVKEALTKRERTDE